jgi:hypothetical protein
LLRKGYRLNVRQRRKITAVSGTGVAVSGISMVACCVHHLVDILPVIGLTGLSLFLSEFQKEFLIFGVVVNLLGIVYMLWILFGKKNPMLVFKYVLSLREF